MRKLGQLTGGILAAVLAIGLGAPPVAADPEAGLVVATVCDDGNTYTTIARASADWNAQLVIDDRSVLHLTWYQLTFEVTAPDGTSTVFGPITVEKGGNDREHKDLLSCTFSFDLEFPDGSTAHVSGPATVWLTPSSGG